MKTFMIRSNQQQRTGFILDRYDWLYLMLLLVPIFLYELSLKAVRIATLPEPVGLLGMVALMRSDLLFDLGFGLFWIGLFAATGGLVRKWLVVPAFHAASLLLVLVSTGAHGFYQTTGSSLDFGTVSFFLTSPEEVWPVVESELRLGAAIPGLAALLYILFGPALVVRALRRRAVREQSSIPLPRRRLSLLYLAGTCLVTYALISLSSLPGGVSNGVADESFARDTFVNVAMSEIEAAKNKPEVDAEAIRADLPTDTELAATDGTQRKNVVIIVLESTRAQSVTPYNPDIATTPYLDDLSRQSLFAEEAYAVVPHTTNALIASICGIVPPDRQDTDSLGDGIPGKCLPELLSEQGYSTAFIQSPTENFERRPEVASNMGFQDFLSEEDFDTEGFQRANYFGYEDDVLLEPSRRWLEENADDGPFMVTYNTITPHHQYLAPDTYGREEFSQDEVVDDYQNSVRYMDFFVENLISQYKEMGLYDDTIFVIQGDHGEGFGEHGRYQHDNVLWNEGIQIPLMVLDPSREAESVRPPASELDILPTVVDLLGYRIEGGQYPGSSLTELPEDRTLRFSCWYENKCLASLRGDLKYIYNYGTQSDEVYDLSRDPKEKNNIIDSLPAEELDARREDLLRWDAETSAAYSE